MNDVDTSTDTINAEFDAASDALGITEAQTEHAQMQAADHAAERDAQIAIAQQMIHTSLQMGLGLFANVTLDNQHTEQASQAYAVLLVKYFPGGIFGLLDRYKEELGALTATVLLVSAIQKAKAAQAEEIAQTCQTTTESSPVGQNNKETGCFTFGETGEPNNG